MKAQGIQETDILLLNQCTSFNISETFSRRQEFTTVLEYDISCTNPYQSYTTYPMNHSYGKKENAKNIKTQSKVTNKRHIYFSLKFQLRRRLDTSNTKAQWIQETDILLLNQMYSIQHFRNIFKKTRIYNNLRV